VQAAREQSNRDAVFLSSLRTENEKTKTAFMSQRRTSTKTNGHAGPQGRPNGHAPASTERGGIPLSACEGGHADQAASDDASGTPVAIAASSASAAGTDRYACAAVAPPHPSENNEMATGTNSQEVRLPGPTNYEATQDADAYVNAVAERVDLVAASVRLVQSTDTKIAKAELDRLRDMKFGKAGAAANASDAPTVIWDEPGAYANQNKG
jgi:hypothetical protein